MTLTTHREKIFACSAFETGRGGIFEQPGAGSALELVSLWRNTCIDTAARLSAMAQQNGREEEVFEAGGLQVLLSTAMHSGNLMPGDIAIQDVHAGLRSLLTHEDAAQRIMQCACEGQVIALLQCPDTDLAGLAAFMCSRLATDRDSHYALLSWAAPARLAKAVQLSGNRGVRFDAMTSLRLLAENPDCHAALLSPPVIKVILRASADSSDTALAVKALRALGAVASTGTGETVEALKRSKAVDTLRRAADANDNETRRAAESALAVIYPDQAMDSLLPAYDSGKGGLSEARPAHTPHPWAQSAHHTLGTRHGASSSNSHHESGAHDFSSLVHEGYSMATQNRGQEYLHAGGLQKLTMLASSSLLLPATARPDTGNGNWSTGPRATANILTRLCKSDLATRETLVKAGGLGLILSLARSSDTATQSPAATSLALLCNNKALHGQLLENNVLPCLFSNVFSANEEVRAQAAKALSHLSHDPAARTRILSHQPLAKLLVSQPVDSDGDAFWAYLSLLVRK